MKNILFAAAESMPFIKTGGLADVIGALPKYLDKERFDARVVMPCYTCIPIKYRAQMEYVDSFYTYFNGRDRYVGIKKLILDGVIYYFIDNEEYFGGAYPYGDMLWDIEKFAFFSYAALAILKKIEFRPDVIHCHDWHASLLPVYLKNTYAADDYYCGIKCVMTIHNLKFQGRWGVKEIKKITGLDDYLFTPDKLEYFKDANCLKGGIVYSDAVTTVSNSYVEEVKTPFYGEGLDSLLWARRDDFFGILNGIDTAEFDPASDPALYKNFDIQTFRTAKKQNKVALQKELGLPVDDKVMMIAMVSRLTDQKGFDLVDRVFGELLNDCVQFVVLGTGDKRFEDMFRYYGAQMPQRVSVNIKYNEALSRRIYAASDAFLMPSLFEPCGLSQLIALRYGSLPIVRETGGLKDTVIAYNEYEGSGTGFSFTNYNAHEMMGVVRYAESVFYDHKRRWNDMTNRAMSADFSWNSSAKKYEELYEKLT